MAYQLELAAMNRRVLTDGHTSIDCHKVFKIIGILKELSDCNCNASINSGLLQLEDGTSYDLKKLLED
jgi:hypothetical protein